MKKHGEVRAALGIVAVAVSADFAAGRELAAFYAQLADLSWLAAALSAALFGLIVAMLSRMARRSEAGNMFELFRRTPGGGMGRGVNVMNPILKYPGAKWRLADWIISRMPSHIGYVEPYFGSGAVFFNKPPSAIETINDIDGSVIRFFRTCRERPEELSRALALTPWSREEFMLSDFCDEQTDDVEAARQFAVRCWMTFGARTRCKTGWRHTVGKMSNHGPNTPRMWLRLPEVVLQVADRLICAQIENRPAVDVIRNNDGQNVLIYADPPYMMATRTLSGVQYRFEMTDSDHEELLKALLTHSGMVMLSGYDCELYRDMLPGWTMESTAARAERGVARTECLWSNPAAMDRRGQLLLGVNP